MHELTTIPVIDKANVGQDQGLLRLILDQFLFPSSSAVAMSVETDDLKVVEPLCSWDASRRAAFDLLIQLSAGKSTKSR